MVSWSEQSLTFSYWTPMILSLHLSGQYLETESGLIIMTEDGQPLEADEIILEAWHQSSVTYHPWS
jgi:hypothetical protein